MPPVIGAPAVPVLPEAEATQLYVVVPSVTVMWPSQSTPKMVVMRRFFTAVPVDVDVKLMLPPFPNAMYCNGLLPLRTMSYRLDTRLVSHLHLPDDTREGGLTLREHREVVGSRRSAG